MFMFNSCKLLIHGQCLLVCVLGCYLFDVTKNSCPHEFYPSKSYLFTCNHLKRCSVLLIITVNVVLYFQCFISSFQLNKL